MLGLPPAERAGALAVRGNRPGSKRKSASAARTKRGTNEAETEDGAHQPAEVEAGRAQHRGQRVSVAPLRQQRSMRWSAFRCPDGRFDRLTTTQPRLLRGRQRLALVSVRLATR